MDRSNNTVHRIIPGTVNERKNERTISEAIIIREWKKERNINKRARSLKRKGDCLRREDITFSLAKVVLTLRMPTTIRIEGEGKIVPLFPPRSLRISFTLCNRETPVTSVSSVTTYESRVRKGTKLRAYETSAIDLTISSFSYFLMQES